MADRPESNEDKQSWCEHGALAEVEFAGPLLGSGCSVFANPAKVENPYIHDLYMVVPADLKTIRTRFRTASRYGIDPRTAITLNKKDVDRYTEKYPHINIIFDIDYGDFKTVRYATLRQIQKAISSGKAQLHVYQNRIDDNKGNAKESYVMDALWFNKLK